MEEQQKVLKWILDYSNKTFPASDYVVAATRGNNPLSPLCLEKLFMQRMNN